MTRHITIIASVLFLALNHAAEAGQDKKTKAARKQETAGYGVVAPIFSQLVAFTLPVGFTTVAEDGNGKSYLREAVLEGETVEHWTQMVTVTGARGLSAVPNLTPRAVASSIADGFQSACPGTYSEAGLPEGKAGGGYEQFAAVVSCGASPGTGGTTSESALVVVIKGEKDYYTIQWAERAAPSNAPIQLNQAKWSSRLARLLPINLCPILPGEAPPYPSCWQKKR